MSKNKSNMPPKKPLTQVVMDYWFPDKPDLGEGKAEEAKDKLLEKNTKNQVGLDAAKKALGLPSSEVEVVNQDKKINSQYGKGGK